MDVKFGGGPNSGVAGSHHTKVACASGEVHLKNRRVLTFGELAASAPLRRRNYSQDRELHSWTILPSPTALTVSGAV
jgi:hypothetical protein